MKTKKTIILIVTVLLFSICMIAFTGCAKKGMSAQEMQQENQQLIDEADQMEVESDK